MINTIIKSDKKEQNVIHINELLNDNYLLPKWERIKKISLTKKRLFSEVQIEAGLYRKFSAKNNIEKYIIKNEKDITAGTLDLKVYKDSVYIINLTVNSDLNFEQIVNIFIQIAVEKTLYNTTNKIVNINLSYPLHIRNKLKKALINSGFSSEANQSKYEKDLFGETYTLNAAMSSIWQKRIKQKHFLIAG